jgi:DNA-binding SARP family transcriptional activator
VNVYISKLRKTLARDGHDPIATSDGGYRLVVGPEDLDADRMRRLVAAAADQMASGESEAAARGLQEALALWRGPSLAGLPLESIGRDEVAQLDELRLAALMDRIDCDLALGRHDHALGELNVLVREHPLRERLRAQQMLALYRADRQADALEAYRQARHALIDELGIEPSESLQRLQQAILRHDPALESPAGTAAANGAEPARVAADPVAVAGPRRRRRPGLRRRNWIGAGLVAGLAAVAIAVAVFSTGGGRQRQPSSPVSSVQPDSVVGIDPSTGKVDWAVGGGTEPGALALGRNAAWAVLRGSGAIERIDLRRPRPVAPLHVPSVPYDVVVDADGKPWVSDRRPVVTRILHGPSGTGTSAVPTASKDIRVPLPAAGAEVTGGGYLWVIAGPPPLRTGTKVALIDLRTQTLASTVDVGRQTTAIAYGYGAAWVGTYDSRRSTTWLSVVRPGSTRARSIPVETQDGAGPAAVAVGDRSVWVLTSAGTLVRVDPWAQRIVHRVSMSAQQPDALAVGGGSVWTANHNGYSISQIDASDNRVVRTVPLGSYIAIPCAIAATRDSVFVAVGDSYCDPVGR